MSHIDVYHNDRKVGQLDVLDDIHTPVTPNLQLKFDHRLRSRNFMYQPSRGDLTLQSRNGEVIAVAKDRMCPGDFSLIVGFSSDLKSYQPDEQMERYFRTMRPGPSEVGMQPDFMSMMFEAMEQTCRGSPL